MSYAIGGGESKCLKHSNTLTFKHSNIKNISLFSVHRPITLRCDTRRARCKDYIKYPPFKGSFLTIAKFKLDSERQSFRFDILFVVCVDISVAISVGVRQSVMAVSYSRSWPCLTVGHGRVRQSVMAVSYHRSWPCPTIGHGARIFSTHIRRFLLFCAEYLTYSHSPALKRIFLASLPPISS